jgi:hypothetical protein
VCGKSARTVRSGGSRKRAHGNDYSGTKPETADTDKSEPTEYRAGSRPYQPVVRRLCERGSLIATANEAGLPSPNEMVPDIVDQAANACRDANGHVRALWAQPLDWTDWHILAATGVGRQEELTPLRQ